MLEALWSFLKDPANRETLGWMGAGIVAVVSAAWAVIKFRSEKERRRFKPSVQATNGGVAAGGNMTGNTINTGGSSRSKNR
jgi:hypothetical protein